MNQLCKNTLKLRWVCTCASNALTLSLQIDAARGTAQRSAQEHRSQRQNQPVHYGAVAAASGASAQWCLERLHPQVRHTQTISQTELYWWNVPKYEYESWYFHNTVDSVQGSLSSHVFPLNGNFRLILRFSAIFIGSMFFSLKMLIVWAIQ